MRLSRPIGSSDGAVGPFPWTTGSPPPCAISPLATLGRVLRQEVNPPLRGLLRCALAFPLWLRSHNRQISRRAGPAWGIRQELVSGEHGEAVTKSTGVSRSAGTSITAQVFRTPGSYSIRPMESLKADWSCALQRKRPRSVAFACGGTFLRSGLEVKVAELRRFPVFSGECGRSFLHRRLLGGGRGIRTLGTVFFRLVSRNHS
jgi:hypothetical protein